MRRRRSLPAAEIPTSPMADIAFLLIIFFLVTATFAATRGLDFRPSLDDPEALTVEVEESVLVEIGADGDLRVDGRPMGLDALLPYLHPKLTQDPKKPVLLRPHPQAAYGALMAVYDRLRQGKERLGLAEEIRIALPTERELAMWGG